MRMSRGRGLTSGGLALVLLLALLAYQKPTAEQADGALSLGPPSPPPAAAPANAAASAPRGPAVAPRRATAPRRVAADRRAPAPREAAPAPKKEKAPRQSVPVYRPMERDYRSDAHGDGLCPAGTQSPSLGVACRGAEVRAAGAGYVLRFSVCTTTAARFELHFPTEAEVGMSVLDATSGQPVWTWQPAQPFRDEAHVLLAEVGSCWVWKTSWAQVDDRGRPLPNALYELQVDFLEVDDGDTYSHRFVAERA